MLTTRKVALVVSCGAAISVAACQVGNTAPDFVLTHQQTGIDIVVGQSVREDCVYNVSANPVGNTRGSTFVWFPNAQITSITLASPRSDCSIIIHGVGIGVDTVEFQSESEDEDDSHDHDLVVRVAAAAADPTITGVTTTPSPVEASLVPVPFTLTGTNFNTASVQADIVNPTGARATIGNAFLTNPSTTSVSGTFAATIAGSYQFSVRNGTTGTASSPYPVTVNAVPTTNSFLPQSPRALVAVAFTLGGTGFDPAWVLVEITGPTGGTPTTTIITNNSLTSKTATSVTGQFPASPVGSYTISVRNGPSGALSNAQSVTVVAATADPTITGVTTTPSPVEATAGLVPFTLTGANFNTASVQVDIVNPAGATATIGTGSLTNRSATEVRGTFAALTPGDYLFRVRNGIAGTPSNPYTVPVSAVPTTSSFLPPSPPALVPFAFTLGGTGFDPGRVEVVITGPTGASSTTTTIANSSLTPTTTISVVGQFPASPAGSYDIRVRNRPSGALSNAQSVTVVAAPACSNFVIKDAFDVASLWTDSVTSFSPGANAITVWGPTGGNPSGYRSSSYIIPGPGSIAMIHRLQAETYDPAAQGAIDHIDYFEDQSTFNGAAIASQFFIQQGTTFYYTALPPFSSAPWTRATLSNLTALSFTPAGLNLGATGSVLHFGYLRSSSNTSANPLVREDSIDNFTVTICH